MKDYWLAFMIGAVLLVAVGWGVWHEVTHETVCPEGFSMVGDSGMDVGVGPVVGGKGGVGVVFVPTDDRQCLRVHGDQIETAEPFDRRKP